MLCMDDANVLIPVTHVQQQLTWDCGISCVAMLLGDNQRNYLLTCKEKIANEEGFGTSTWTIDLCYLLKRFGVRHIYRTITLGVNTRFVDHFYYKRSLKKDLSRVEQRFRDSPKCGVVVECREMTLPEMLDHLSGGNPMVVLVDASSLYCDTCESSKVVGALRSMLNLYSPYQGHYVVVCGYRLSDRKFLYRNPAKSNRVCTVPFDAFEHARKQFGTDQDVILVQQSGDGPL
ncbi:protein GUCD1-like [Ornithodoros turicata]|uniref:protein GUCD1-like n=1 Tax=Ornithodoros turicata TaxID=34597 RepID=UPI003139720A